MIGDGQADIVETRDADEVILVIDTARARRTGDLDAGFDRVVRDLVMGVSVTGADLDAYGIAALGILTSEELAARAAQAYLFEQEGAARSEMIH